jgi:hypothetical protein
VLEEGKTGHGVIRQGDGVTTGRAREAKQQTTEGRYEGPISDRNVEWVRGDDKKEGIMGKVKRGGLCELWDRNEGEYGEELGSQDRPSEGFGTSTTQGTPRSTSA